MHGAKKGATPRGRAAHPGVVLVPRPLSSGTVSWRARWRDPDTGRTVWKTLDRVALNTAERRVRWASDMSQLLAAKRAANALEVEREDTTVMGRWLRRLSQHDWHLKLRPGTATKRRVAAHDRAMSIIQYLISASNQFADPEIGDDDEWLTSAIETVTALLVKLSKLRAPESNPQLDALVRAVETATEVRAGTYYPAWRFDPDFVRRVAASASELSDFTSAWPEHPIDRSLAERAINEWHGRKKWQAFQALARDAGLAPPSTNTMKTRYSRANRARRHRDRVDREKLSSIVARKQQR